jgi:hypothetical protein
MSPRPDIATWQQLLQAFTEHGGSVRKVVGATGVDRATVTQAWNKGWPGVPGKRAKRDPETGEVLEEAVAPIEPLLPIKDIMQRATLHARRTRDRIYKDTVKAQVQFAKDATDDAMRQRSLEAMAVRTSLMLGDTAVSTALKLQLATAPVVEQLATKLQAMADDPERSAGAMMKVLREIGEFGRLAAQQLETAMVLERKHLGKPEGIFAHQTGRSSEDVAAELRRMLVATISDKMTEAAALEEKVIDVIPLKADDAQTEEATPDTAPPESDGEQHVWSPEGLVPLK